MAGKNAAHFGPGGKEFQNRLDQLFQVNGTEADKDAVLVDRDLIERDPHQPRKYFPVTKLAELGKSIRTVGQLHAILIRPHPDKAKAEAGIYMIVVGERRWRSTDPEFDGDLGPAPKLRAVIRILNDFEAAQIQIEENDVREDVSPLAVARGYQRLYDILYSNDSSKSLARWKRVAAEVGVAERTLHRYVALLDLPGEMQAAIEEKELTAKHGRALTDLAKWPGTQKVLFRQMMKEEISGNESLRRAKELADSQKEKASGFSSSSENSEEQSAESSSGGADGSAMTPAKKPVPAKEGTGMSTSSEPTRIAPIAERRKAFMDELLSPVAKTLQIAAEQYPTLGSAAGFKAEVQAVVEEMARDLGTLKRELKK